MGSLPQQVLFTAPAPMTAREQTVDFQTFAPNRVILLPKPSRISHDLLRLILAGGNIVRHISQHG
jgi:hypothetical protein